MKRCILALAALVTVPVGHASADYLAIRVDLNNITLNPAFPQPMGGMPQIGGGFGKMGGGAGPYPGPVGKGGGAGPYPGPMGKGGGPYPGPMDQQATQQPPYWVTVYVELKFPPKAVPGAPVLEIEHKWGNKTYIPLAPFLQYAMIEHQPWSSTFARNLKYCLKVSKEQTKQGKEQAQENKKKTLVNLAGWAWSHGLMKEFHGTIEELKKLNPKHAVVLNHARVQAQLKTKLAEEGPALSPLLSRLVDDGYRLSVSEQGRYGLYANLQAGQSNEAQVKRRLARLEENLEYFYYWFALQDNVPIPPMPKKRLLAVLMNEDFKTEHALWGSMPALGEGFTPRRDNILILAPKRFDDTFLLLENSVQENAKIVLVGRDELLSGRVWERKEVLFGGAANKVAILQTLTLVQKALEEESERTTLSHEGARQLLAATGLLPGNVEVPEWVLSGLASYFEIPYGAVYGRGGLPSWSNLVAFKHHRKNLGTNREILFNVLSDHYFQVARRSSSALVESGDNDRLGDIVKNDWERARSTAWALVYHLIRNNKFNTLIRYSQELSDLPRDLDLERRVLEACFAKAFDLGDPKSSLRLHAGRLQGFADAWFAGMDGMNLELLQVEQDALMLRRLLASQPKMPSVVPNPNLKGVPVPPPPK